MTLDSLFSVAEHHGLMAALSDLVPPDGLSWVEPEAGPGVQLVVVTPPRGVGVKTALFSILWNAFVMVFLGGGTYSVRRIAGLTVWTAAGIAITYYALCALLNRTTVRIGGDVFAFRRAPIPVTGAVRVPRADVAGFQIAQVTGFLRTRDRDAGGELLWCVGLRTRDGGTVLLRFNFDHRAHAEYAARRLTQMLGLAA